MTLLDFVNARLLEVEGELATLRQAVESLSAQPGPTVQNENKPPVIPPAPEPNTAGGEITTSVWIGEAPYTD